MTFDGRLTWHSRDDVDEHMIDRAQGALLETPGAQPNRVRLRHALRAALTPEPPRPHGAEELQALIQEVDAGSVDTHKAQRIADYLAERGVRVTGAGP